MGKKRLFVAKGKDTYAADYGGAGRGECFNNASTFISDSEGLLYCEGLMYDPKTGIAIHHAWTVDAKTGEGWEPSPVIDPVAAEWGDGFWDGDREYWGWVLTEEEQDARPPESHGGPYFSPEEIEGLAETVSYQHPITKLFHAGDTKDWD